MSQPLSENDVIAAVARMLQAVMDELKIANMPHGMYGETGRQSCLEMLKVLRSGLHDGDWRKFL